LFRIDISFKVKG